MNRKERLEMLRMLVPARNTCLGCDDLRPVGITLSETVDLLTALVAGDRKGFGFVPAMSCERLCSSKAMLKRRYDAVEKAVRKVWSKFVDEPCELLVGDRLVMDRMDDAVWELEGIHDDHANEWRKNDDFGRKGKSVLLAERDSEGSVAQQGEPQGDESAVDG